MTKKWLLFLTLMAAPLCGSEFSLIAQKHYVPKDDVELQSEMIVVHIPEGTFVVDAICADRGGVYFYEEMMRCPQCYRPINPKNTCQSPLCSK
jgi:hypothetical protein